ncbi:relaxase/mobilization nuclease domain-containing protein [Paucibacter sp. JuS9]|uniref:relaxase/mobilization nuclease domain-containing protein n=1 Tax=Paucibacter sp. JuS9 TaxID=3228748 RepID=UPI003756A7D5
MKAMQNVRRGNDFRGVVRYVFKNKNARHLCNSDAFGARNQREMVREFDAAYVLRPDCKTPVWHQALRLPAGEYMSDERLEAFARDYLQRMGFRDGLMQWTAVIHDEPEGLHLHIVASRVALDGQLWYGRNANFNTTKIVADMEIEYGLSISRSPSFIAVVGPDGEVTYKLADSEPRTRKASTKERQRIERINNKLAKAGLDPIDPRGELQKVLALARSKGELGGLGAFLKVVEDAGIIVHASIAGQDRDRVQGLSFSTPDGSRFAASDIGRIYSWPRLSKDIGYQPEDLHLLKKRSDRDRDRVKDATAAVASVPKSHPVAPIHPVLVESALEIKVVDVEVVVLAPLKTQTIAEALGLASVMDLAPQAPAKRASDATFARRAAEELLRWMTNQRQRAAKTLSTTTSAVGAPNYVKHPQQLSAYARVHASGSSSLTTIAAAGGRTITGQATLDSLRTLPSGALVLDTSRGSQQGAGLLPRDAAPDLVAKQRASADGLRRAPAGTGAVERVPSLKPGLLSRGASVPADAVMNAPMPGVLKSQTPSDPPKPLQKVGSAEELAMASTLNQATLMHQAEFQRRLGKILASLRERVTSGGGDVVYLQAAAAFLQRERAEGREPDLVAWREFDRTAGSNAMALAHLPDRAGEALSRLSPAALRSPAAMQKQVAAEATAGMEMEVVIEAYGRDIMEKRRSARDASTEAQRSKRNRR